MTRKLEDLLRILGILLLLTPASVMLPSTLTAQMQHWFQEERMRQMSEQQQWSQWQRALLRQEQIRQMQDRQQALQWQQQEQARQMQDRQQALQLQRQDQVRQMQDYERDLQAQRQEQLRQKYQR